MGLKGSSAAFQSCYTRLMSALKIVSINIEGSNHLTKVTEFVQQQQPDVVCLQELFTVDVPYFEKALGMECFHTINADVAHPNRYVEARGTWGLGIFTKLPTSNPEVVYYVGSADKIPELIDGQPNSFRRGLQSLTVTKDNQTYTIANTHMVWTPKGSVTDEQRLAVGKLLEILAEKEDFILVGDFNSPRGRESFDRIALRYKDNIPEKYTSSLDPQLHRAGDKQLMVDGLFTTDHYQASEVALHTGVSDHQAVTGFIQRR